LALFAYATRKPSKEDKPKAAAAKK
jgi:hypothetical protein